MERHFLSCTLITNSASQEIWAVVSRLVVYEYFQTVVVAQSILEELESRADQTFVVPSGPLMVALALGDVETAVRWAQACVDERTPRITLQLTAGPDLLAATAEPALAELLPRLGLP